MSQERQFGSDDDDSWRPQRKRRASATRPSAPVELVPGVDVDDLPIAEPFATKAIAKYQVMPVAKKLDWRTSSNGRPNRRSLSNRISLTAAFIQTRGIEVSESCFNCQKGLGPWQTCVIMVNEKDSKLAGTCANCQFSRKYDCNFRAIKIEDTEDIDFEKAWELTHGKDGSKSGETPYASRSASPKSSAEMNFHELQLHNTIERVSSSEVLGSVLDHGSRASCKRSIDSESYQIPERSNTTTVPKLQTPSITTAEKNRTATPQSLVDAQVSLGAVVVKEEQATPRMTSISSSIASKSKSRLDGDVLPFPLGPEAFDNLPLLRQAIKDTENHLEAMRKRVRDLEVKEEQESYNPWDYI